MYGDMRNSPHIHAYRQSDDGSIWSEMGPYYMNLEYYDRELTGTKRILKAISSYLKGELEFELLVHAYSFFLCEEYADKDELHMHALLGDALFEGKAGIYCKHDEIKDVTTEEIPITGIYRFMNSHAIAKHCQQINHPFTPLEMAYLIHESEKHTIPEKHAAWKKLIATTPDMAIKERRWTPHFDSLHQFLEQYMQIENKYIDLFYRDEADCMYSYQYLYEEDSDYCQSECIYKDFHSCYKAICADIADLINSAEMGKKIPVTDIRVKKQWFNQSDEESPREITLCITYDNIPVNIWNIGISMDEKEDDIYFAFEGLWLEIPTPFKRGDILIGKSKYWLGTKPYVLDDLPYWDDTEWHKRILEIHRKDGDASDMVSGGYRIDSDATICEAECSNYLYLEYYDGPLEGASRILIAVSEYLKGEIDIETLMHAYNLIKHKQFAENERQSLEFFTEEGRILAGLR